MTHDLVTSRLWKYGSCGSAAAVTVAFYFAVVAALNQPIDRTAPTHFSPTLPLTPPPQLSHTSHHV